MSLIKSSFVTVRRNIIFKGRVVVKRRSFPLDYILKGRDWKIFLSITETGREIRFLPDTITISMAGSIWPFILRKTSRIFLLARLRTTALPIFLEAITPNLCLSRPLGKKNTVQKFSIRCLWPWSITCSNWGLLVRCSFFLNEYFPMELNSQTFASFAPSVGQNSSTARRWASFKEPVGSLSLDIFRLKRHFHSETIPLLD